MATAVMMSRHEDNRMGAGKSISQINTFAYRNKHCLCRNPVPNVPAEGVFRVFRGTLSAQEASKKPKFGSAYCAHDLLGPERKWLPRREPPDACFRPRV